MTKKNIFYAQSGGVTAVINASACGVIETARRNNEIGNIYAGKNGILGALHEEIIDTKYESNESIAKLKYTPAAAFGSCRYKINSIEKNQIECKRLIEVFKAHDINYFLYNGGGDSADTCIKISHISKKMNYPIQTIHIPKTIDNDLAYTDNCPGFGSTAKYIAISIREAGFDIKSMCNTSTKIFILEVMGRHSGWIAGASGLASESIEQPPHIILFPEIIFNKDKFIKKIKLYIKNFGYCVIVASEGIKNLKGQFITNNHDIDAFGHVKLGGIAPYLAQITKKNLGYKYHWAVADYLQRSARHIASKIDIEQAYAMGVSAVNKIIEGKTNIMPVIIRKKNKNIYNWSISDAPIKKIANFEKTIPADFITDDGFHITNKAKNYFAPLITGENYPSYESGLPKYVILKQTEINKKLKPFL